MKINLFTTFLSLFSIITSSVSTDFICDEKQCMNAIQPTGQLNYNNLYSGQLNYNNLYSRQLLFLNDDLLFIVNYPINYEIKYISPLEYNLLSL